MLNITASDVKDAKLTATVTIPAVDVDAAIKKAYKDTAKKYRFPASAPARPPSSGHRLCSWRRGYPRSGHQRPDRRQRARRPQRAGHRPHQER